MWICSRCQGENRDAAAACERCGSVRPAGRFGSAPQRGEPPVRPPRVTVPAEPSHSAPTRAACPPPPPRRGRALQKSGHGFARWVGWMLSILLPLLTVVLAFRQYDVLAGALVPLFLDASAQEGLRLIGYIVLACAATLVSLLPGLWTLLLAGQRPKDRSEQ